MQQRNSHSRRQALPSVLWAICLLAGPSNLFSQTADDFVLRREFIYTKASFLSAHASTIVETPNGTLLAAWFGGSAEGHNDVEIWLSRKPSGGSWSAPVPLTDTPEMPVWNPVLFQDGGTTYLYFKVGPSPREWVGGYRTSGDDGLTWNSPKYLPAGLTGPIRSKMIRLSDGTWLAGTSVEAGYDGKTPENVPYRTWAVWIERSTDRGQSWTKHGPVVVPGELFGVIQPALWETRGGEVRMLMRSTERIGKIAIATSKDGGRTWTPARPTVLPNPNSGLDVVKLPDGRLVLIYNHLQRGRQAIHLATSADEGETWSDPILLEKGDGEFSYPAVILGSDGRLHITYTWKRTNIRYLVVDPLRLPR
jgi:predicted neuraminidase